MTAVKPMNQTVRMENLAGAMPAAISASTVNSSSSGGCGFSWSRAATMAMASASDWLGAVLLVAAGVLPALPQAVVERTRFHAKAAGRGAVTNASMMQTQMEANFRQLGYHLGIPGRILEMDADELAGFLARARTGELWGEEGQA